jgi:L-cysteine/cystine lyase
MFCLESIGVLHERVPTLMSSDATVLQVRTALPVTESCAYFNTGSLGPISSVLGSVLKQCTDEDLASGRAIERRYEQAYAAGERVRDELGRLLGVDASRIALTHNTSSALRLVIERLPWRRGDEVVVTNLEHPQCLEPLRAQAARSGFDVKVAQAPGEPDDDTAWLAAALSPKTRLVVFSGAAFRNGARLPVEGICRLARGHGALTLLDAAQYAGVLPLEAERQQLDFCALPLQKWLCGPEGLGALFVRPGIERLGTDSIREHCRGLDQAVNAYGVFAAAAAHLEWLRTDVGWQWIYGRTLKLAAQARELLVGVPGLELLTPSAHAGLTTVTHASANMGRVVERLRAQSIIVRSLPELHAIRVSTAFFNTEQEIERLARAIFDCLRHE